MAKIWFDDALDLNSLTENGDDCMPGYVGIRFIDYGDDWIKASMPVNERTKQPYGRLHGGASVVLAETIGSVGAAMTVDRSKFATVGMEINANHVRPAYSGWVTATVPRITRLTPRSINCSGPRGPITAISTSRFQPNSFMRSGT